MIYLAWWIVDGADLSRIWSEDGHHGSFWLAVDTVVAVTVSWAPLVADYTRFSRDRRSAFFGVGIGYLLPTLFQFGFGSILVLSRGVDPNHPELILTAIAGGGARRGARAARADRRRDRRGVRQRLLDRRLDAEPRSARIPHRALDRRARPSSRPPQRSRSTCAATSGSCCCSARSSSLCSASSSRTGCSGRSLQARGRLRRRRRSRPGRRRVDRRLLRLRVARAAGRSRFLVRLAPSAPDPGVPDRRVAPALPRRVPADGRGGQARLGACRRSPSSGTSPGTSLTASRRASAERPSMPRGRGARSAVRGDHLHALRARRARRVRPPPELARAAGRRPRGNRARPRSPSTTSDSVRVMTVEQHGDTVDARGHAERRAAGRMGARGAAPSLGLSRRDARRARPRPPSVIRRPGPRARTRDRARCGSMQTSTRDARARSDPQAGGGGGRGDRGDRQARRARGARHVWATRLACLLRRPVPRMSARGRSRPIRRARATRSRRRTWRAGQKA